MGGSVAESFALVIVFCAGNITIGHLGGDGAVGGARMGTVYAQLPHTGDRTTILIVLNPL
jgi:hypothetical protein